MRDGGRCLIFPDAWQDDLQDPAESRASPRFPQTRTAVADVADGVKFSTTGPLLRARSAVLYPVASLDGPCRSSGLFEYPVRRGRIDHPSCFLSQSKAVQIRYRASSCLGLEGLLSLISTCAGRIARTTSLFLANPLGPQPRTSYADTSAR